jgi:nicotinamidase-related amidase
MKRALLVIDVQNEYFLGKLPVTHPPGSLENILAAMDAAQAMGVPVVVIQHTAIQEGSPVFVKGSMGWGLHLEVFTRPRALYFEKHLPGSFTNTNLEAWLFAQGLDTVTICGYMANMCCDTTARQAMHLGFNVEFLADATGALDIANAGGKATAEELHRATLVTQAMRFSKVMTTKDWMASL